MQTFLPYESFADSAKVLDKSRLGNQFYREGLTLLRGKWHNHPASKMWRGYELYLCYYLMACSDELRSRGYEYLHHDIEVAETAASLPDNGPPPWLGNAELHASHRANLLRKDPEWYGQFGWEEEPTEGYVWPV